MKSVATVIANLESMLANQPPWLNGDSNEATKRREHPVDVLAISAAARRLRMTFDKTNTVSSINTYDYVAVLKHVIQQDLELAANIRSYYESRLIVASLGSLPLSAFHAKLLAFLRDSPCMVSDRYMGLIYRLPYFYLYDMELTRLAGSLIRTEVMDIRKKTNTQCVLHCLGKINREVKLGKYIDYWFRSELNEPMRLPVKSDNILISFWDKYLNNNSIDVNLSAKYRDDVGTPVAFWDIKSLNPL